MKKLTLIALRICAPASGFAGGSAGSIGVGGEISTLGPTLVSVNYDAGAFHVGGGFGFSDERPGIGFDNALAVAGRFYYHLHSTALADFGVGAEILIVDQSGSDNTGFDILGGFQIRSFISTNVALSFTGGFVIGAGDASDGVGIGATPVGAAGVHYYFF